MKILPLLSHKPLISAVIASALVFVITLGLQWVAVQQDSQHQRAHIANHLDAIAKHLEGELDGLQLVAQTLALLPSGDEKAMLLSNSLQSLYPYIDHWQQHSLSSCCGVDCETVFASGSRLSDTQMQLLGRMREPGELLVSPVGGRHAEFLLPYRSNQVAAGCVDGLLTGRINLQQLFVHQDWKYADGLIAVAVTDAEHRLLFGDAQLLGQDTVSAPLSIAGWHLLAYPWHGWQADWLSFIAWSAVLSLLGGLLAGQVLALLHKRAGYKARLQQQARAMQLHSDELQRHNAVLEMIGQRADLRQTMQLISCQIEALHPSWLCSIMLLNSDDNKLWLAAGSRLPEFYQQMINGKNIAQDMPPCALAAWYGERMVVTDIQQHPAWRNYRLPAMQARLGACWSEPICDHQGMLLGVMALYQHGPAHPDENALAVVSDYLPLIALATHCYRTEESLLLHDAALDAAAQAIAIMDREECLIWANQAYCQLMAAHFEQLHGKRCASLKRVARERPADYQRLRETILSGQVWHAELISSRIDGGEFCNEMSITPIVRSEQPVQHFIMIKRDITLRKQQENKLKDMAFNDPLTGLPNRRLLLEKLLQVRRVEGMYAGLMFIDLDNFKPLNDNHGHDTGDRLLIEVGQRLTACVTDSDTVARLGGDEFAVLLSGLGVRQQLAKEKVIQLGEQIRKHIAQPYHLTMLDSSGQGTEIEHVCSCSIGLTLFNSNQLTAGELLKHADTAMYQAKQCGRNQVAFYQLDDEDQTQLL